MVEAMEFLWSNGIPAKLRRPSIALASLAPRPTLSEYLRGNYPREPRPAPSTELWTIYKVRVGASGPVIAICTFTNLSIEVDPLQSATLFASEEDAWRTLKGSVRRATEDDVRMWRARGRPDVVAALDVPTPDARDSTQSSVPSP